MHTDLGEVLIRNHNLVGAHLLVQLLVVGEGGDLKEIEKTVTGLVEKGGINFMIEEVMDRLVGRADA